MRKDFLSLHRLTKTYAGQKAPVLKSISLRLQKGQILAVVGESGSGKSTLLKAIAGLIDLDKGRIEMEGTRLLGPSEQLVPGHPDVKMVTQDHRLMPNRRVEEGIRFQLRAYAREEQNRRTQQLLEDFALLELAQRFPPELSGGQRQRAAFAVALADYHELLLLDEPFSNLDRMYKEELKESLQRTLKAMESTAVLVTHDPLDALSIADLILVLRKGRSLQLGTPKQLYLDPKTPYIAALFAETDFFPPHHYKEVMGKVSSPTDEAVALYGIRTAMVKLGRTEGGIKGRAAHKTYQGHRTRVRIELSKGIDLHAYTDDHSIAIGTTVTVQVPIEYLLRFDSEGALLKS